jgi:hypothetical protein
MSVIERFFASLPRNDIDNWVDDHLDAIITIVRLALSRAGISGHRDIAWLISSYIGINAAYQNKPPEPERFRLEFARRMGMPIDHDVIIGMSNSYAAGYEDKMAVWRKKYPKSAQTIDYLEKKKAKTSETSKI